MFQIAFRSLFIFCTQFDPIFFSPQQFLSMKLATVNPQLDFNLQGLAAKDVSFQSACTPARWIFLLCNRCPTGYNTIYIFHQILQQRLGPSSALGFALEMPMDFPQLHPPQLGLIHSNLPSTANSSDMLTRTIHSEMTPLNGGFKEPNQVLNLCCNYFP